MIRPVYLILPLLLLMLPAASASATASHYVPQSGDTFSWSETIVISNGNGNYSGYTENDNYIGNMAVTAEYPNGTVAMTYQESGSLSNNQGQSSTSSEKGSFMFSASTFLYVQGTDNQTGYVNPSVWFYMDNTQVKGGTFNSLNTAMTVVSTNYPFPLSSSSTGYVSSIMAEGNGSYQRNDDYGNFAAQYNWKEYFDPGTGYIVGYQYTEQDSDGMGDSFTWTDTITDTSTSFHLTTVSAPQTQSSSSNSWILPVVIVVVILVVVIVVIALLLRRSHSRGPKMDRNLPRHEVRMPTSAPTYAPPAPVRLVPSDQPSIQQIVIRETVKVPCTFCGTLIDSTATQCPKCGAPRT